MYSTPYRLIRAKNKCENKRESLLKNMKHLKGEIIIIIFIYYFYYRSLQTCGQKHVAGSAQPDNPHRMSLCDLHVCRKWDGRCEDLYYLVGMRAQGEKLFGEPILFSTGIILHRTT